MDIPSHWTVHSLVGTLWLTACGSSPPHSFLGTWPNVRGERIVQCPAQAQETSFFSTAIEIASDAGTASFSGIVASIDGTAEPFSLGLYGDFCSYGTCAKLISDGGFLLMGLDGGAGTPVLTDDAMSINTDGTELVEEASGFLANGTVGGQCSFHRLVEATRQ
jgi:hypothetical protein